MEEGAGLGLADAGAGSVAQDELVSAAGAVTRKSEGEVVDSDFRKSPHSLHNNTGENAGQPLEKQRL